MGHYALTFNFNFNNNSEGSGIVEHFLPYSLADLAKLELKGKIGKTIEELFLNGEYEEYPLDAIFNNDQHHKKIEHLEYVEESFQNFIFDDELDSLSVFRTSLWDMLSDASLVKYAADRVPEYRIDLGEQVDLVNPEVSINRLAEITVCSQIELCALKIKTSLLAHLEIALTNEILRIREEEINVRRIRRDIEFYEKIKKALKYRSIPDDLRRTGNEDNGEDHDNEEYLNDSNRVEVNQIEQELRSYIAFILDEETPPEQVRADWMTIDVLSKELEKAIRAPFERACEIYEVILGVRGHKVVKRIWRTIPRLKLFLDERHDVYAYGNEYMADRGPVRTLDCIADDTSLFAKHARAVIGNDYYRGMHFFNLSDYVGTGNISSFFKKRYRTGTGCFALLITKSNKHYFSFSGMTEELKMGAGKHVAPIKYIMENILNKCSIPDIFAHNYKYNFAYITHSLEVRRYTDIVRDNTDYIGKIGPYIDSPETYADDYSNNPAEDYNRTYSCCERKMLAYSGYDNVRYIFSRWAPCWKCCPAVIDTKCARVFAFTTLQEFFATGGYKECEIKEYFVKCDRAYTVKSK